MILAAALILLASGSIVRAEIIDRILAVAGADVVTLSDVRAVLRFELVPPAVTADPIGAALQHLIDRRLILTEIERYAPPDPPDAAITAGVAAVHARFEDALAFEIALNQTAMSHEELREYVRDTIRIEMYLQQRFGTIAQSSEDELLSYYRGNPGEFTVDGVLRPFDAVREEVRVRLGEQRRATLIAEWQEGLRRRSSVVVLYLPGRG